MIKLPGLLLIGNRFISPKKLEQDKYYRLLTHLFYKDAYFGCSYPSITVYNCLNDIKKTNKHYYKTLYKLRNNYKQFLDLLTDNFYYLDKTNEYIPQGICSIDRSILVSMYDAYGKQKSKIVIVDKKKEVLLDIPIGAHVGGITYDEKNNLVWATNTSGRVSSFSYHDLINKDEATPQYTYKTDLLSASFITYYDGCMYVGSFNNSSNGKVISYIVNDDGTIGKKIEHFTLPSKVQGIAFYKKDEITYMVLSRSYGRTSDSLLEVYDYNKKELLKSYKMPPMLEQISFDKDGNLIVVFENNADKYRYTGKVQIPSICELRVI